MFINLQSPCLLTRYDKKPMTYATITAGKGRTHHLGRQGGRSQRPTVDAQGAPEKMGRHAGGSQAPVESGWVRLIIESSWVQNIRWFWGWSFWIILVWFVNTMAYRLRFNDGMRLTHMISPGFAKEWSIGSWSRMIHHGTFITQC